MNAVESSTSRREFAVSGMTCANCARHVGDALRTVPGVDDAQVDLAAARVAVVLKPASQVSTAALQSAVKEAGYELKELPAIAADSVVLRVEGMDCQSCVRKVTTSLQAVSGVDRVVVDLARGEARVHWKVAEGSSSGDLLDAVKKAGYTATLVETAASPSETREDFFGGWKLNVLLGGSVTAALVLAEWVFQLGMERWFQWVAFVLATPVQIFCGARFYRGAWNQLKSGNSNMDTLVSLGSTTAFAYSVWGLFTGLHQHLYFMEAASIITLISIGHWMEARVSAKAAGSLKALMELAPTTARRLSADGKESDVPVALLRAGDRVVLKPGDRVPTDGVVGEGASAVDESMLTGESLPVDKMQGDRLYGGTINQNGRLVMQVTATGEATALAQIVAVVQRAQGSRASIQKLGDRVSSVFVPVVVLIAMATAAWWGLAGESARAASSWLGQFLWVTHIPDTALAAAVVHAAAVLIIACPCAMGLATPAAIMAGTNAAARRGILIRDGAALEKSGTITAVLFDKTGTLTRGEVVVAQAMDLRLENDREQNLEKLAASLARGSNHPLSKAIARLDPVPVSSMAPPPGPTNPKSAGKGPASFLTTQFRATEPVSSFTKWEEVRGSGVQAQRSGRTVRLGSIKWVAEQAGKIPETAEAWLHDWSGRGATVMGIASGSEWVGLIALRDELKEHAFDVVAQLACQGKSTFMLTGDSTATALAMARSVGIPSANVFAEVRPERKAEIVRELQERGEKVAFVGDGINDAPALEQADLGVAVAKASDVAREAADIILLKSDIQAVPEALGLAQATLRTIKQNLFWAFFYNAAAIPLAVMGFLSPVICAAAMGFSDLIVIGNALRLRRWKP